MCDERAAMRALLRDWGGSSWLLREMERQRVRAGREYDLALAELDRAHARLNSTPDDAALRAAAGEAAEKAGKIAAAYARAYERLREQVGALEAASYLFSIFIPCSHYIKKDRFARPSLTGYSLRITEINFPPRPS